jgi:hypothetical protein
VAEGRRGEQARIDRPQHRHYQWPTPEGATYGIDRDFEGQDR